MVRVNGGQPNQSVPRDARKDARALTLTVILAENGSWRKI